VGEKAPGLLFPDPLPSAVDGFHQIHNGLLIKAPGEISTGCRIRNALRAQAIQKSFIVAPQFDIFQPLAIQKRIVGQVQHMITLVIGQMVLEQLHPPIDLLG